MSMLLVHTWAQRGPHLVYRGSASPMAAVGGGGGGGAGHLGGARSV